MKSRILFVDDDRALLDSLKAYFNGLDDDWQVDYCENAKEALELMEEKNIHVVVADLVMPEMDGIEFLTIVKNKHPQSIRIILSGHSEKVQVLRSSNVAHQILSKPYEFDYLKLKIEKTTFLRNYLQNEKLINTITGINHLPSLPQLYIKLEEEIKSQDVSMQKIGEIISQDIAMTAKILQLVNSGFFGLPNKISNPQQAVQFLGTTVIKTLVLYIQVFDTFKAPPNSLFSLEKLWNHSIKVGNTAREIIRRFNRDRHLMDDAYVGGILHDIGILVLLDLPDYLPKITKMIDEYDYSLVEAEYELYGTSHAEVGAYLLGVWGLPYNVVEAVAFHHNPSLIDESEFSALTAIHIANAITRLTPYIDLKHIKNLKIENNLVDFIDCCLKF